MEFFNPEGLRRDGRRERELRRLKAELGVLSNADGSAMFSMGNTKVMAAVFGPRPVERRADELHDRALVRCEYSMARFSTGERRRRGKEDRRSAEITLLIKQTMEETILVELLPKTQIDIFVQVIQADGGTRCACINAAMLAVADAGIPCKDLAAACAAGYLQSRPLLDMNYEEDAGGGPDVSMALHPAAGAVISLQMDNKLPVDVLDAVVQLAADGCRAVAQFLRNELQQASLRRSAAMGISIG